MKFCEKCEISYCRPACPVCELKRELKLKDRLIEKILEGRESLSENRILNIKQLAKAINRKPSTIYQDRSRCNELQLPLKRSGRKLTIALSDLKKWAEHRDENLNLVDL